MHQLLHYAQPVLFLVQHRPRIYVMMVHVLFLKQLAQPQRLAQLMKNYVQMAFVLQTVNTVPKSVNVIQIQMVTHSSLVQMMGLVLLN